MLAAAKVILVILSVLLIAVILMQSGRSAGLSGVIMGSDQAGNRRAKGMDSLLAKTTVVIAVLFFLVTLGIAYLFVHHHA